MMKSKVGLLALGLAALSMPMGGLSKRDIEINAGGGDAEANKWRKNTGQKKFTIDGVTVWAMNIKNAQRKVNNLKKK